MRLKKLEVIGFKSFGKKTTFSFEAPITAIVGPNGSGKSNVAEAIRWVLGEQSMKSLRGRRGEDLIFGGTASVARQNRAAVTLVFDNADHIFGLDFDEVAVSREVHRDGVNTYSINGSPVRLRDVYELLSRVSLGATSHHIVSQGESDRTLSATPMERREILEDALGLKIYQFKITESERRLEKTSDNVKEIGALRREIAPHLKFLKKQVDEIAKVKTMREDLRRLGAEYFATEGAYLDESKKILAARKHEVNMGLARLREEYRGVQSKVSESDQGDEKVRYELELIERELTELQKNKEGTVREMGRLEGKLSRDDKIEDGFIKIDLATGERSCRYCGQKLSAELNSREKVEEHRREREALENERGKLAQELKKIEEREVALVADMSRARVRLSSDTISVRKAERALFATGSKIKEKELELERVASEEAQIEESRVNFAREAQEISVLTGVNILAEKVANLPAYDKVQQDEHFRKIERLKIKIEDAGGLGTDTIKEYEDTTARDEYLARELSDLEKSSVSLKELIDELSETLAKRFENGLSSVNTEFANFFNLLFGGGNASLELVKIEKREKVVIGEEVVEIPEEGDEDKKEVELGIDIKVSLPRKKIKGLEVLSGGERALTSIALLFAMTQVNPPPFLVLDETDAALDEANSRKYGEMLERLSKSSQLIVITHNRETMAHALVLYGVTMGDGGVSHLLSIRFDSAVEYAK